MRNASEVRETAAIVATAETAVVASAVTDATKDSASKDSVASRANRKSRQREASSRHQHAIWGNFIRNTTYPHSAGLARPFFAQHSHARIIKSD